MFTVVPDLVVVEDLAVVVLDMVELQPEAVVVVAGAVAVEVHLSCQPI
jgi:hypothetical protein